MQEMNIITYTVVILDKQIIIYGNFAKVTLLLLESICTECQRLPLTIWENRAGRSDTILSATEVHEYWKTNWKGK